MAKKKKVITENTEETKGVLILALGHPYYGRMAAQLAMSIKTVSPNTNITVVKSGISLNHLNNDYLKFFDNIIECPKEYYTNKKGFEDYIKAKLFIYDLTPYDKTIYLDADMVWVNRDIEELFYNLNEVEFTIQNRGAFELGNGELDKSISWWCNVNDILPAYNLTKGTYFSLSSEFIYIKRANNVKKYFEKCKWVYNNMKVNYLKFANGIPDEIIFSIAMILEDFYPHKTYFVPIYWEQAEKRRLIGLELSNLFYAYSLGGKIVGDREKKIYNDLVQKYCNQNGLKHYFQAKDKMLWLPERQVI